MYTNSISKGIYSHYFYSFYSFFFYQYAVIPQPSAASNWFSAKSVKKVRILLLE